MLVRKITREIASENETVTVIEIEIEIVTEIETATVNFEKGTVVMRAMKNMTNMVLTMTGEIQGISGTPGTIATHET